MALRLRRRSSLRLRHCLAAGGAGGAGVVHSLAADLCRTIRPGVAQVVGGPPCPNQPSVVDGPDLDVRVCRGVDQLVDLPPPQRAGRSSPDRHHPGGRDHQRHQRRSGFLCPGLVGRGGRGPPSSQFRRPQRKLALATAAARGGHRLDLRRGRGGSDGGHPGDRLPHPAAAQQLRHQWHVYPWRGERGPGSPVRNRKRLGSRSRHRIDRV